MARSFRLTAVLRSLRDHVTILSRIDRKLTRVLNDLHAQGVAMAKANDQVLAFLDKLDTYTNALAAAQTTQTAKITEIAADIDRLLSENASLDPAVAARLQAASDGLAQTVAFEEAQAATLTAVAAKDDNPLPDPVPVPDEPPTP